MLKVVVSERAWAMLVLVQRQTQRLLRQVMPMPIDGTVFDLFWAAAGALLPWCFVLIFKYSEYLAISTCLHTQSAVARDLRPYFDRSLWRQVHH